MSVKLVTIVGARPQFIKAAAVSRVIRDQYAGRIDEVIVHTGQHFDDNMSAVFFDELDIPRPRHELGVAGGSHGAMTGRMLEGIEKVLVQERPDRVLVYGDTNSTLAGALAAVKLHIPVAHVEAGLRSFNRRMPEEVNRVVTDHLSSLLCCPTETAVENLGREGIERGVHHTGDVMYDAALFYAKRAASSDVLARLGLVEKGFALATCHRAENTDDPTRLGGIVAALAAIAERLPVVLPLHPRTRKQLEQFGLASQCGAVRIVDPLSFLEMVALERAARLILTDSGGVQKEAFFYGVPCLTMRDETEWVETVSAGANQLVGADRDRIVETAAEFMSRDAALAESYPYGRGNAAGQIVSLVCEG